MRGIERAWVLGFAAVVWVAGCGSSAPRPIDKGSGGGAGGVGGAAGANTGAGGASTGAGGASTGAGGASTGAGGVTDGGADVAPGGADGGDGGVGGAGGAPCTGPNGLCTDVPDFSNGPDQNDSPSLAWFNLEAAPRTPKPGDSANWAYATFTPGGSTIDSGDAVGFIQHAGDMCGTTPCGAAMPVWSHDGATIVYVSTNAALSGRLNQEVPNPASIGGGLASANSQRMPGMTNLFVVPFNRGGGGIAQPITGAATTSAEEYYPGLSFDDSFVAFTHVPAGEPMYINPHAEISVVPRIGGSAVRVAANDPPACSGRTSPGVDNIWARFAPGPARGGHGIYYWLLFSSTRANLPPGTSSKGRTIPISQLYLAPVRLDDETFNVSTYPAVYLWNQPTNTVNTMPDWNIAAAP